MNYSEEDRYVRRCENGKCRYVREEPREEPRYVYAREEPKYVYDNCPNCSCNQQPKEYYVKKCDGERCYYVRRVILE